ncbi:MAG: UDP-N-acetylmuramate--L-alanine ligase [Paludibacteraceae bacterium]|nr:UDP-N-acetylmuramate--L-alanine ligase [Paludibacteraceae bacterium]
MSKTTKYDNYYFLGIGGIGMSALARYFKSMGANVAGYDRTRSALCEELERQGIQITYTDTTDQIPARYKEKEKTLVVFTPAIPKENEQRTWFESQGFLLYKRAQVLGLITREKHGLCVSGTHGKTTTCNMIANILSQTADGCNAFLGGISNNFKTNLLLSERTDYTVIEADEFDRSFHQLRPHIAVITAADADHLDIYGSLDSVHESFEHFTSLIQPGGTLILKKGVQIEPRIQENVRLLTYSSEKGAEESPDFYAEDIHIEDESIAFDFVSPKGTIRNVRLGVPVRINVENAVAAMAVCQLCGASDEELATGIATFAGTRRRFEKHGPHIIDDYAHHPAELKATIESVQYIYGQKKILGLFQPHLYSRTRDLAQEFAEALSLLKDVLLLPIYPARELPIEGVSSQTILEKITTHNKAIVEKKELLNELDKHDFDLLLTIGAGDIDLLLPELENYMESRFQDKK